MSIPDMHDLWLAHDRQQQQALSRLPVCDVCEQPIQDEHLYLINGEKVCPDCLDNEFRREVEDFTE